MLLGLVLIAFTFSVTSTSFFKDSQNTNYECELDVDADENDRHEIGDDFIVIFIPTAIHGLSLEINCETSIDISAVSKNFTLFLGRKRSLTHKNLKLFC